MTPAGGECGDIRIKHLGLCEYRAAWEAMRRFTRTRSAATADEIWTAEHPPVYTLGAGGDLRHLLRPVGAPVIKTDRGGQITYHGPGQTMGYALLDLRRRRLRVRDLAAHLERAIVDLLAAYGIAADGGAMARSRTAATAATATAGHPARFSPGVYVGDKKIAALGLRISGGRCYHGVALNVDLDLRPFAAINPCGFAGLGAARMADFGVGKTAAEIAPELAGALRAVFVRG